MGTSMAPRRFEDLFHSRQGILRRAWRLSGPVPAADSLPSIVTGFTVHEIPGVFSPFRRVLAYLNPPIRQLGNFLFAVRGHEARTHLKKNTPN